MISRHRRALCCSSGKWRSLPVLRLRFAWCARSRPRPMRPRRCFRAHATCSRSEPRISNARRRSSSRRLRGSLSTRGRSSSTGGPSRSLASPCSLPKDGRDSTTTSSRASPPGAGATMDRCSTRASRCSPTRTSIRRAPWILSGSSSRRRTRMATYRIASALMSFAPSRSRVKEPRRLPSTPGSTGRCIASRRTAWKRRRSSKRPIARARPSPSSC